MITGEMAGIESTLLNLASTAKQTLALVEILLFIDMTVF